ncbi:MAG TPA: FMN-binding negative transcriptional regulator [Chitinophagaceae bacterium]|nr:FMN-binding negative transcriptional regulator [Chitinophagaceae bacterium]
MYNVTHFKASDQKEVIDFMHAHPFIVLCGCDAEGNPVATHVPALVEERDEKIFLRAHTMRKQEHTKAFAENPNVLAIFHGAHTYVSASWYENKQVASTWNYQAVHAKGILRFKDEKALRDLLVNLTQRFENNPHSPALVQNMDDDYVTNMMKAIIAFEIEVTGIEHVFKLSQNRDEKSYENIIKHLSDQDADAQAIAATMKERQHKVFPS